MPVYIDPPAGSPVTGDRLNIGMINNMPDEALKATERQYTSLLGAASAGTQIHLSLYTLPGVPRSEASTHHIASRYSNIEDLWEGQLDGLIVTGREPLAARLEDEPYWDAFSKTLGWAQQNAHSTVWSCLAAHAAVLKLDGIERVKRADKLFGVFACERATSHPLMATAPRHVALPHSRWNGLPENMLAEAGYTTLTRTAGGEVDTFLRQQKKLFVFFQGHPEYEANTLLREYRRDLGRYFKQETPRYPSMPQAYFDPATVALLNDLQLPVGTAPERDRLTALSAALSTLTIENTWRSTATGIYEDWLAYIGKQKHLAARSRRRQSLVAAPTAHLSLTMKVHQGS